MADPPQVDDPIAGLLDGWGAPPPRDDFVDRVTAQVDGRAPSPRGRRGRAVAFGLGAASAGLVMAVAITLGRGKSPGLGRSTHVHIAGVADVVGEEGARVEWQRRADGGLVVEVVEGIAWVRRAEGGPAVIIVADGSGVAMDRTCGRVEVTRRLLSVDATVDDVECRAIEAAIERTRAELSD